MNFSDLQFCPRAADTFVPPSDIFEASEEDLVSLPSNEVLLGDWIFPNSLRFGCNGTITRWIFRAEPGVDLISIVRLPQWSIFRDHPWSTNEFELVRTSGSIEPGVYQYTLNFPVVVLMGEIVGLTYDSLTFGASLRVSFRNSSRNGTATSISYRRSFSGVSPFLTDTAHEENEYLPLVTPIMGTLGCALFLYLKAAALGWGYRPGGV